MKCSFTAPILFVAIVSSLVAMANAAGAERVYSDDHGIIRWRSDGREVALFGANYSLASSCDYRAAGYIGADRKKLVEQDLTHFTRMGWDGIRLCFWGDWESCDAQGNLIANDYLDVLDYSIAEAAKRGIGILFTPITTYSSIWPDGKDSPDIRGFSKYYPREKLGTDPAAIAAQCNYLRQILNHVNPYTGVALKDEPSILFVEMINEPVHHSADLAGSIAYINALADAVRSTGCSKLLFHNLSQDFDIAPAIKASSVPGMGFAWYPTGLNVGYTLSENYLRSVDDFTPMANPALRDSPKLVYEFDSADMNSGYMYPAMVRSFRGAGAQFIAMFSYDMLATAPYNLGWQTHFLNLVASPRKAVSAIIAAEATRVLPLYSRWGDYPANRHFGPFRVSYEEDTSEMVTPEKFIYANNTATAPANVKTLRQVIGLGSSPIVSYEGCGIYFLERLAEGTWRLELYPDALIVKDPFSQRQNHESVAIRLVERTWPMSVMLPDLGTEFSVTALNQGNTYKSQAQSGRFEVRPGVYLLSKDSAVDLNRLPQRTNGIALTEYVCLKAPELPAQILPSKRSETLAQSPTIFIAEVIDTQAPKAVSLHLRSDGKTEFSVYPMLSQGAYSYAASVPASALTGTKIEYYFSADTAKGSIRFPEKDAQVLQSQLLSASEPLRLLPEIPDGQQFVYSRIGDSWRQGVFKNLPATASDPASLRIFLPQSKDANLGDYSASLSIKDRLQLNKALMQTASTLRIKVRGAINGQLVYLTLIESDGTSWSVPITLGTNWQETDFPLSKLQVAKAVMLPLGYPGQWNYWLTPAQGRGGAGDRLRLEAVEHLQISLRPDHAALQKGSDLWVDIAAISLK